MEWNNILRPNDFPHFKLNLKYFQNLILGIKIKLYKKYQVWNVCIVKGWQNIICVIKLFMGSKVPIVPTMTFLDLRVVRMKLSDLSYICVSQNIMLQIKNWNSVHKMMTITKNVVIALLYV